MIERTLADRINENPEEIMATNWRRETKNFNHQQLRYLIEDLDDEQTKDLVVKNIVTAYDDFCLEFRKCIFKPFESSDALKDFLEQVWTQKFERERVRRETASQLGQPMGKMAMNNDKVLGGQVTGKVQQDSTTAAELVRNMFQKYYKPKDYKTLLCIEAILQDHGILEDRWQHTYFMRQMVEWGCLNAMDEKTEKAFRTRLAQLKGKLDGDQNFPYKKWGGNNQMLKEKCKLMAEDLAKTFPYKWIEKDD